MLKNFRILFFLFLTLAGVISLLPGCKVAKNLPQGESLLVKNKFILKTKAAAVERQKIRNDLANIAAQKPNKRIFGFAPVRMWMYYSAAHSKKLNKFKQWVIDKVGEAPVVYDSALIDKSNAMLRQYLWNFGYFRASVKDTVITKNKKTEVIYTINTDLPWHISDVELPKGHNSCDSIIREHWKGSLLKRGDKFDVTNLKGERDRIENVLRNSGYFTFNREYVTFDMDSDAANRSVLVKVIINQPSDTSQHQQYRINNIYVISDYSGEGLTDSTRRDTITIGEYRLIAKQVKFRKGVLLDAIFFKQNDLYTKEGETRTINRFSQMGTFKFINVDYVLNKDRPGNYLDVVIGLTPGKRNAWGYTAEVNISDEGLFGTVGSLSYQNKNLTKGADQLILDMSGGVQLRFSKAKHEREKVQLMAVTATAGVTYYMNKFLVPFRNKIFSRNANPRTRINLNYSFEHRYDFDENGNVVFLYQLHVFNASFGYEWNRYPRWHHLLNPIAISFYLLPLKGTEFYRRLDAIPILKSSFEEQVIIGPNYSFTYSNKKTNTDRTYMLLIGAVETAGNVIYAGFTLANLNKATHDSVYLIANRPFAQYFRVEADWRNYVRITNHSMFAIRTFGGIGVPYGNSAELPFIKQFYVGGPNSLRGFLIREIGPGGYSDPASFDPKTGPKTTNVGFFNQTGDLKLEANAEVRFDIYKWLKGAIFADAGNVWSIRPDGRALGNFDINRFMSEIAIDAGAGLRLDFNFFVVRFDYGFPLRDPRYLPDLRWRFANAEAFKTGQFQLAIGYPF